MRDLRLNLCISFIEILNVISSNIQQPRFKSLGLTKKKKGFFCSEQMLKNKIFFVSFKKEERETREKQIRQI